jgi:hypothetical protein
MLNPSLIPQPQRLAGVEPKQGNEEQLWIHADLRFI